VKDEGKHTDSFMSPNLQMTRYKMKDAYVALKAKDTGKERRSFSHSEGTPSSLTGEDSCSQPPESLR
jgi:hypothetical protein